MPRLALNLHSPSPYFPNAKIKASQPMSLGIEDIAFFSHSEYLNSNSDLMGIFEQMN